MVYQRFFETKKKGPFLNTVVYIPMKSYETVLAYLTYKGKTCKSALKSENGIAFGCSPPMIIDLLISESNFRKMETLPSAVKNL